MLVFIAEKLQLILPSLNLPASIGLIAVPTATVAPSGCTGFEVCVWESDLHIEVFGVEERKKFWFGVVFDVPDLDVSERDGLEVLVYLCEEVRELVAGLDDVLNV